MTDVSKTNDGWTEEQARKIGEATEESVRESGADVGASVRAESDTVHDGEHIEKLAGAPAKKYEPAAARRRKETPPRKP